MILVGINSFPSYTISIICCIRILNSSEVVTFYCFSVLKSFRSLHLASWIIERPRLSALYDMKKVLTRRTMNYSRIIFKIELNTSASISLSSCDTLYLNVNFASWKNFRSNTEMSKATCEPWSSGDLG